MARTDPSIAPLFAGEAEAGSSDPPGAAAARGTSAAAGDLGTSGIPESALAGPFAVGEYAAALRGKLRSFSRVQVVGELVNVRISRARVYFELRDAAGALPCAVWRTDWEKIAARAGAPPADGMQVVVAGGCDYYAGSATSSPGFSFSVTDLRVAGEGDLLARIDRLRKQLDAEGLLDPQKQLKRVLVPRTIGIVTGEQGKARDDVLAALARRGWAGRLVWGFAPVQDRHAAPAIVRVLGDLAALADVDVVIVARGGGSLADLLCFCDETLCRTVALLKVPVIASVGHHTDRTLLDDVAAVSCSTPTHAAEAAVMLDCVQARNELAGAVARLRTHGERSIRDRAGLPVAARRLRESGRRAVLVRARLLSSLSRAPGEHLERQRTRLHQQLREIRAGSRRRTDSEREVTGRRALVLARKGSSMQLDCSSRRPRELAQLELALEARDPQRTLERGYALVKTADGAPVTSADAARAARDVRLRFADETVDAHVKEP
ncbi:MAG TPA: exodeoxyribonuclease VII large subunit [Solirubrobacteraceae bacterium]|nr:exodeoxyribonuclease VII large subunit [Solirubrobacteraceae bacterium]